jgi:hypothetical protein
MKTRYRFFEGTPGKFLVVIALAAVLGFMGCPTDTEDEEDPGPETLKGSVSIVGDPQVGNALTADPVLVNASGTPAYVWKRGDTATGTFTPITGAASAQYTVTAEDNTKFLQVTVSYDGNKGSLNSRPLGPVGLPRLGGKVEITGTLAIGATLTADTAGITAKVGDYSYVWGRGDGLFEPITDATGATYVLTEADAGKSIQVIVSAAGNSGDLSHARGPVPVPPVPLTADIVFTPTGANTAKVSFVPANWTGAGEASEAWTLTAEDASPVYFTVTKTENQIIRLSGTHAAKVSQLALGETRDGSTAGDALGVFGVMNIGEAGIFNGDKEVTREFTLNISEQGKAPKTVSVTLNISPRPMTGVAIFKVLEDPNPKVAGDEVLERIHGFKHFVVEEAGTTYEYVEQDSPGDGLLDALAWIDRNAEDKGDYLVRVEKDEEIPRIVLSCLSREVRIRLRGYGQVRKITYNKQETTTGERVAYSHQYFVPGGTGTIINPGPNDPYFIKLGSTSAGSYQVTLQLENNITLRDGGETNNDNMIRVNYACTLIMLDGSTITGASVKGRPVIYVYIAGNRPASCVYMYGGTIMGNTIEKVSGSSESVIYFSGKNHNGVFVKEGGSITGNSDPEGNPVNTVKFLNDPAIEIKEGVQYSMPPIPVDEEE